jgi:CheY-like chemotaxis protein
MTETTQPSILIVEDSPENYEATVRALRKSGLRNLIFHCADGDEALDFLYRRGAHAQPSPAPRPSLILLDLNLPRTDRREVLATIKHDDQLRQIPIIVLTTSEDARDIGVCYATGANSYMKKPVDLEAFMQAMQRLKDYWFEVVILPKEGVPLARTLAPDCDQRWQLSGPMSRDMSFEVARQGSRETSDGIDALRSCSSAVGTGTRSAHRRLAGTQAATPARDADIGQCVSNDLGDPLQCPGRTPLHRRGI